MKRSVCVIMICLLFLLLAACKGGDEPTPTEAPESTPQAAHTPDMSFDPDTDNNNLNSGFWYRRCAMLETDEVYYLIHNGYLMYYDKAVEESGYVCPLPECVHDGKFANADCCAYLGAVSFPSLTVYEGKLWWVGQRWQAGQAAGSVLCVYRMDPDGTNRELMHEIEIEDKLRGNNAWFIHRGRLYWTLSYEVVTDGLPYYSAEVGYMSLDDYEQHVLYENISSIQPYPTIRFLGESAYIFISYDWIEPGEEPDGDVDYEAYANFWRTNEVTQEILRWDPSMAEPETVYYDYQADFIFGDYGFYVSPEGEIYFWETEFDDPEDIHNNDSTCFIRRVTGKDSKETALTLIAEDGMRYFMKAMPTGIVIALHESYEEGTGYRCDSVWLLTIEGETLYRGELPMAFLEKYSGDMRRVRIDIDGCWATKDEFLIAYSVTFPNTGVKYDFVNYEITREGIVEKPLASCKQNTSY